MRGTNLRLPAFASEVLILNRCAISVRLQGLTIRARSPTPGRKHDRGFVNAATRVSLETINAWWELPLDASHCRSNHIDDRGVTSS